MATIREERAAIEAVLNKLVPQIITALGPQWRLTTTRNEYTTSYFGNGPDGKRLEFNKQQWPKADRLVISGRWPGDPDPNRSFASVNPRDYLDYEARQAYKGSEITVAMDRAPEIIALEIERRLLPGYSALLVKVQEGIKRSIAYTANKDATLKAAAAAFGISKLSDHNLRNYSFSVDDAEVEIYGEHEVCIKLRSLTVQQAAQIAAIVKTKGVK